MKKSMNSILIETTVRNTIKQIKEDPERNIRNIVDMAFHFSNGRFQKHFLSSAQSMLQNENSCYYKLVPDIVSHVDTERIVNFGMNIGYHSCTVGAQKIRSIEQEKEFNIPWAITLSIDGDDYIEKAPAYHSLIEQGQQLGIYTWNIFSLKNLSCILELAAEFPESAFTIFCSANEITPDLLEEAKSIYNIMFVLRHSQDLEKVCSLLRSKEFLYSIYYPYKEQELTQLDIDSVLTDSENLHATFTIFIAVSQSSKNDTLDFYQKIVKTRKEQTYKTIPFEMIQDNLFIDSIISEDACTIGFTPNGSCYLLHNMSFYEKNNYFDSKLNEILRTVVPKNNNEKRKD